MSPPARRRGGRSIQPIGDSLLRREARRARPGEGTRQPVGGWPIAAAITVVILFFYYVREILLPFVLAAAVAFVVTPVVDRLASRISWLPRWAAALIVYIALVALAGALGYRVGTLIAHDITTVVRELPKAIENAVRMLVGGNAEILGQHLDPNAVSAQILDRIRAFAMSGTALYFASLGITAIFGAFLGAVLVLYFLISGYRLVNGTLWLVPPEHRPEVAAMVEKVGPLLRRYLIGLACVVVYTTSVAWIGFGAIFKLPHAPLLSIMVGLLELIPVIGPLTSAALVGVVAMQQGTLWAAAGLAAFAIALRLSIDQLIGPLVLGKAASVHPVVVIFAFLSGAVVFGVIGLILAVPVAATIRMVLDHYYREQVEDEEEARA